MPAEPATPEPDRTLTYVNEPVAAPADPVSWGQFRDLKRIGGGGFGAVYRAWDPQLHREVALKLLIPRPGRQDDQAAGLSEARMMARVRHPNVVPVYGVGIADGRVGFWSELIEGPSLAALVKESGAMSPRDAAAAVAELCRAVTAMHAVGILHRDIKAENVLRDESGRTLLTDFGLSRDPGERFFGGTPAYMAPELLEWQPHTVATDIFALGVLLLFLATARFADTAVAETKLPSGFKEVVNRAIAPQPEARYTSAQGMLLALESWLAGSEARKPRPGWVGWTAAAAVAIVLAGGGVWFARRYTPGNPTVLVEQGLALMQRRDKTANVEAAQKLFASAVQADPKSALAHAELADALWTRYRQTRDEKLRERAALESDRAAALDNDSAQVFLVRGRIHIGMGKRTLAAADFSRALRLDSRNADVYREMAQMFDAEGRVAEAEGAFQKAIDLDPNYWLNFHSRGSWLLARGRIPEALQDFQRELKLTPDNASGLIQIARAHTHLDRLDQARGELEKAIKLAPREPSAYNNLGFLLMQQGKYDEAASRFEFVTRLTPANYLAWGNLASATQLGSGGMNKARPLYRRAIAEARAAHSADPLNAVTSARLGDYAAALGDREECLTLLRQALLQAPEDAEVLFFAGEAYEILGMREQALRFVGDALRRGYPLRAVKQSPDLAQLLSDSRFPWPSPAVAGR